MSLTKHGGSRNKLATLERIKAGAVDDSSGHVDETDENNWEPVTQAFLEVHTLSLRQRSELMQGGQIDADVTHEVALVFDPVIWSLLGEPNSTKMRWNLDGRILNFSGPPVNENEDDKWISFPCMEAR